MGSAAMGLDGSNFIRGLVAASLIFLASPASGEAPDKAMKTQDGDVFQDCDTCPEMITIPTGAFAMGADTQRDQEHPIHDVIIARSFAVSKYPITVLQYRAFAEAEPEAITTQRCLVFGADGALASDDAADWSHPGFEQADDHPAVCVSWMDMVRYLRWLNAKTGRNYRLLSEAEWEYVARAGDGVPAQMSLDAGNWGAVPAEGDPPSGFGASRGADNWRYTSAVDAFSPNAFGVYDMLGNSVDLVADCPNYDYVGAPNDGSAWLTPDRIKQDWAKFGWTDDKLCFGHILRGRSWAHPPAAPFWYAHRGWWYPAHAAQFFGFRVAVTLDEHTRQP